MTSLEAAKEPVRSILETHYGFDHVMLQALTEEERDAVVTTIAAAAIRAYLEAEGRGLMPLSRSMQYKWISDFLLQRAEELKDSDK